MRLQSKTPTTAPPEPHTPSTPSSTDSNKLELDEEVQACFESGIWGRAAQDSDGEAPPLHLLLPNWAKKKTFSASTPKTKMISTIPYLLVQAQRMVVC